jgi:L-2,4-diaminobutyric acid acetyltransferase
MSDTRMTTESTPRNQQTLERAPKVSTLSMTDREVLLDPDGVAVRGAIIDEGALLWELARDAGGIDLNSPYAYLMQCRNFHETCVVAEVFGTPAGFITAHRVPTRPHVLFVWQVAVLPEFRGLGIGQRMLDALVERPACTGVRKLEATVTPSNTASRKLFAAFAKGRGAELDIAAGFARDDFPDDQPQESERLFTIQPIHSVD